MKDEHGVETFVENIQAFEREPETRSTLTCQDRGGALSILEMERNVLFGKDGAHTLGMRLSDIMNGEL